MPTPSSGTFLIKIGSIRAISLPEPVAGTKIYYEFGEPCRTNTFVNSPATNLQILNATKSPGDGKEFEYDTNTVADHFVKYDNESDATLNKGTINEETFSISGLPAGFIVLTAKVDIRALSLLAPSGSGWSVTLVQDLENLTPVLVHANFNQLDCPLGQSNVVSASIPDGPSSELFTLQILYGFGPEWHLNFLGGNAAAVAYDYIAISGTYILQSFQFTLNPKSMSSLHSRVKVIMTEPSGSLNQLSGVFSIYYVNSSGNKVLITTIPVTDLIIRTDTLIEFIMPDLGIIIPVPPEIIIEGGTTFGGQVPLGPITILLTNGSGIYEIVPGKTHDTYYDRSIVPSTTINVKIVDPFGKTGFF